MKVNQQHGVGQAIDPKHTGEELEPAANPLATMLEILSRELVFAAQKGPPNTPLNGVKHLNLRRIRNFVAWFSGHERIALCGREKNGASRHSLLTIPKAADGPFSSSGVLQQHQ